MRTVPFSLSPVMVPPDTSSWRRLPYCVLPTLCVALTVSDTLNTSVPDVGDGMPSGMPQVQDGSGTMVASPLALPALPPLALPPLLVLAPLAPLAAEAPAEEVAPPFSLPPAVPDCSRRCSCLRSRSLRRRYWSPPRTVAPRGPAGRRLRLGFRRLLIVLARLLGPHLLAPSHPQHRLDPCLPGCTP